MPFDSFPSWLAERGIDWEVQAAKSRVNAERFGDMDDFWAHRAIACQAQAIHVAFMIMSYELRYGS